MVQTVQIADEIVIVVAIDWCIDMIEGALRYSIRLLRTYKIHSCLILEV